MSKQLTPIGIAIEHYKNCLNLHKEDDLKYNFIRGVIEYLEFLLHEEKQFAEDAYKEGFDSKECTIIAGIGESFPSYTQDESFNDYYKKYEDENKDKA